MEEDVISRQLDDDILTVEHVSNYYYENGLGIFQKRKKNAVLKDVSFSIHRDEFFGVVGESGCGKSTLANCILNLIPFEGKITVAGKTAAESSRTDFTKNIQAIFQDPLSALDPGKTIGFTMREPLRAHKIGTKEEQIARVNEMLETVGLDASYADRYPKELSGGQRQRVCIGASLMLDPPLIIADEAISALDVSVGSQILNLFREIDRQKDFAMLFISHNLNVVYYLCDRIAVLYRGMILELGEAEDIYRRPAHPYTKVLLSAIPAIHREDITEKQTLEHTTSRPDVPGACPFYHRCAYASDKCTSMPAMRNIGGSGDNDAEHLVRCHLAKGGQS